MRAYNYNLIDRIYKLKEAGKRQCGGGLACNPVLVQSPLFLTPLDGTVHIFVDEEIVVLNVGEIL